MRRATIYLKPRQFLLNSVETVLQTSIRNKVHAYCISILLFWSLMMLNPLSGFGQCNPAGNVSRYEFEVDPTVMLNLVGQQFCTSQSMGTNCCGNQNSYRCMDLVFNLNNGPNGETFSKSCNGVANFMTTQGNFDALFFNVGVPNPAGNATNCAAPINLGNNYTIGIAFSGNNMGQIVVDLNVFDKMGNNVFSDSQIATAGQSVIFTICKPGFGCIEDEIVFGCCSISGSLALNSMAASTICDGASTTLKLTGMDGVPPYTAMMSESSILGTNYFPVTINDDMDGNPAMDMTTFAVSPGVTTTYKLISIEDANGCAQPANNQMVTINVNPVPTVDPIGSPTFCAGDMVASTVFTGSVPGTVFTWSRSNEAIGLIPTNGIGDVPAFPANNTANAPLSSTFTVTPSFTDKGVTCTGQDAQFSITVNPVPKVTAVPNQVYCAGDAVPAINFFSNVPGSTFAWMRTNEAIGLGASSGDGNIPGFTATNAGNTSLTATFTVIATFSNNGVMCVGAPMQFTITVHPKPNAMAVPAAQTICSGNAMTSIVLSGNVPGTTFNWTRNNTVSVTGIPAAGAGNISGALTNTTNAPITVTFTISPSTTNCPGTSIQATVLVNPSPAIFTMTGGGAVCTTDNIGVQVGLNGSQTNVNYQLRFNGNPVGAPVAGTGAAISFGTQLLPGNYTVIATHLLGGCSTTMNGTAVISTFSCSAMITDPCVCLNNASNLTDGQFGESFKVNAPGSQTWTITSNNGLYSTTSPVPPGAPIVLGLGTTLQNVGGNMFLLNGRHIDAVGYTISISNNLGTSFTLSNSCQYPNPEITTDLNGEFCLFSNPLPLNGTPGDGNIISAGFTVNGIPANQFNPGAGIGQYEIVYTVNGGTPKAFGPNDPGCIQSVSKTVNVVATPSNLVCNNLVIVALNANCTQEINPDMILEGTYLCFDDYIVELDCTPPLGNGPWTPGIVNVGDIGHTCVARVTHLVSGNKCSGNIKVVDNLPPVMVCESFSIPCSTPDVSPFYLLNELGIDIAYPTVTDCQSFKLTWVDTETAQNCASGLTKTIERRWKATDASGNMSTCIQTISLVRPSLADITLPPNYNGIQAPGFDCSSEYPSPEWIENQGLQGFPYYGGFPSACNINWSFKDILVKACDGTYNVTRNWTLVDLCTSTLLLYTQSINVADTEAPIMVCPDDLTVSVEPFDCCGIVNLPDIIVKDNCSRINNITGTIATYDPYTNDLTGIYPISGTLQDFPGNNWWDSDTMAVFGFTPCLPIGTQIVTYRVQDACGNTLSCNFELTIEDQAPPVAACDQFTTVALGSGNQTLINASTFDDGSYDNCCLLGFQVARMDPNSCGGTDFGDTVPFCCSDLGDTVRVVFQVTDCNGNTNQCMVLVEVQDKLKPVCTAPANVVVSCENFDPSLWVYGKANAVDNCCLDDTKVYQNQIGLTHSANYTLFDTVCNKGTITRTFKVFDCTGNSTQCTQRIIVNYEQDFYVKFPNDAIVTVCDGTGTYGEPSFFGEDCELLGVSFEDEVFTVVPDACFKIERTWTIINWCTYNPNAPCIYVPNPTPNANPNAVANLQGPTVSACGTIAPWAPTVVKINPTDQSVTNYCTFWDQNSNCYRYKQIIKIIDGQAPTGTFTVPNCSNQQWLTANHPSLWNESYWWHNGFQTNDLCEEPTDLCITGTDACSGSNINIEYLLFLDLDNDGVMETVVNSVNTGLSGLGWNNVLFNNLNTQNFAGGTPRAFDERAVPVNQKYGFTIEETVVGNTKTACVRWNTQQQQNSYVVPELPHGTHKIKWFITDGCGNNKEYEYTFTVKDCKPPTVLCFGGLSVNIMPTGMIQFFAADVLDFTQDNCTPANQIKVGIRKCGMGNGFPLDINGNPATSVTYTCNELGINCIELWVMDAAGNADYCETYVIIQDNLGNCSPSDHINVSGVLKTTQEDGIEEAVISINGVSALTPSYSFAALSDASGLYAVNNSVPLSATFEITPQKDDNPLNGVTTYDLVLISKHILGLEPLNSPYKMIAADANKSGSITTFDVVELRKLILGIYAELPNNTSWRFVDKGFDFPNVLNPFQTAFPENILVNDAMTTQIDENFVGVKIGDVNNTAVSNLTMVSEERTAGTAIFDIEDRDVSAGETFEVAFKSEQALSGFQFTMLLEGLKVIGVLESEQVTAANFGLVFDHAATVSIDGAQAFTLRFMATKSGKLSEMIGLSGSITRAEAYSILPSQSGNNVAKLGIAFRFGGATISGLGFELYQNQPNPFVNRTNVGFYLPQASEATFSVFDETGRLVYQQKGQFEKGENTIALDRALINATGVLYYRLETATDAATKKMIQKR